jgi:hypothetical protein
MYKVNRSFKYTKKKISIQEFAKKKISIQECTFHSDSI